MIEQSFAEAEASRQKWTAARPGRRRGLLCAWSYWNWGPGGGHFLCCLDEARLIGSGRIQ